MCLTNIAETHYIGTRTYNLESSAHYLSGEPDNVQQNTSELENITVQLTYQHFFLPL